MSVMTAEAIQTEEFSTEWVNYGDVNPEPHGGRFVRWDAEEEKWEIVETNRADAVMPDGSSEVQVVGKYEVYPDDVWQDGNPEDGFTDAMAHILEAFHENGGLGGPSPEPDSPVFMEKADYYIADMTHHVRGRSSFEEYDDYDGLIARFGVDDYDD